MLFKEFGSLDEAIAWANHVKDSGRVALLNEGDDGTRLDRSEIAMALLLEVPENEKGPRRRGCLGTFHLPQLVIPLN